MAFKVLLVTCLVGIASAAPQYVAHSHAQITLNKASIQRDTIHDTPSQYHQPKHYQVSPVVQHQPSVLHNGYQRASGFVAKSEGYNQYDTVQHVNPVVHNAHYNSDIFSNSLSYSSHEHSAPVHQTLTKIPLEVKHVKYVTPTIKYTPVVAKTIHAAPVVKFTAPVTKYVSTPAYHQHEEEHYGPAEYSFEYSVHDEHTGDIKSQKETRHGDHLEGHYMLVEPDGSRRVVDYSSDKDTGFQAVVHHEEINHH